MGASKCCSRWNPRTRNVEKRTEEKTTTVMGSKRGTATRQRVLRAILESPQKMSM